MEAENNSTAEVKKALSPPPKRERRRLLGEREVHGQRRARRVGPGVLRERVQGAPGDEKGEGDHHGLAGLWYLNASLIVSVSV